MFDHGQIRTPVIGVLLGYVVACATASLVIVLMAPLVLDPGKAELSPFALTPLVLAFCFGPFAILRLLMSQAQPNQAWKFAVAGAVLGAALGAVFSHGEGRFVFILAGIGALSGLVSFFVEDRSKRVRLHWMLGRVAAHPTWAGTLTEELNRARRQIPEKETS